MRRSVAGVALALLFAGLAAGCAEETKTPEAAAGGQAEAPAVDLSPGGWPAGEWEKYLALEDVAFPGNPLVEGRQGAVTGSYHALAQRAGLEALRQGGSSVDAAMTTALTQVALGAGAVISYFGIITMVHYDAAADEIVSLNAGWNAVLGEDDPMSIPGTIGMGSEEEMYGSDEPSGRTALVGGFMKAVEAAHGRYGKLDFEHLFAPAIHIAEAGIPFSTRLVSFLEPRKHTLSRLPESKALFTNADGAWIEEGQPFRQPALAGSLKAIAEQGADYMYTGPWAERAVAAVQADGGSMSLEDLAAYEVMWVPALEADVGDYRIHANGLPSFGGVNMIEALHLGEAAGIRSLGHWSTNGESLRRASNLTFNMVLSMLPAETRELLYPGLDLSHASRIRPETADALWSRMEEGAMPAQYAAAPPSHSDTVVAVDQWGNMTAVTHSINCVVWGATGIIVDGISIGDPAVNQKAAVAAAGPGGRVADPIEVGILTRNGRPAVAFASMATGLHQQTFQSLFSTVHFGMNVKEAVDAPAFFLPRPVLGASSAEAVPMWVVRVMTGEFDDAVLEASGLPVEQLPAEKRRYTQGLWTGISRDPETGELMAAAHPYTNGQAFAY
ncbi:MAG: gamma-glutamyltransferase [Gammaproteobacteria bacterium]|nr:gamma-glutamyltransferase [Gammaproteobacteria bacterium]